MRALRLGAVLVPLGFVGFFFVWPVANIVATGLRVDASNVLGSPRIWQIVWFTLWQAVVSTLVTAAAALPAAWALARVDFRGKSVVRALLTVPFVLPTVVVASAFVSLSRSPLTSWATGGIVAILAAHVFFNYAVITRIVGSAWGEMHPVVTDAGRVLGASPAGVFRRITLPLLRPSLAAAAAIVFLFTFTSFGVVLILGGTRWATLEVEIYRRTAQLLDLPAASLLALLQMGAVAAALLVWARMQAKNPAAFELVQGRTRPSTHRESGRLAMVAFAPAALLIGIPVVALVAGAFSNRGGPGLVYFRALSESRRGSTLFVAPTAAVVNSVVFALAATVLAVAVGGLAALVIASRSRHTRPRRVFDTVMMLPLGTSAVTLGFGLLITFDSYPFDLRSSIALVPLAHALVGIPFVVRTLVPALRGIPPTLRDAARTLGADRRRLLRRVELPLVWRSALVGAGFAGAVSLGEFGATAFLARPTHPTVPVAIFRFLGQPGALNRGQALALSVILMLLVVTVVLATEMVASRRAQERILS